MLLVLGAVLPWFVVVGVVFSIVVLGSVSSLDGPRCCVPETLYYGVLCSMLWCCSVWLNVAILLGVGLVVCVILLIFLCIIDKQSLWSLVE